MDKCSNTCNYRIFAINPDFTQNLIGIITTSFADTASGISTINSIVETANNLIIDSSLIVRNENMSPVEFKAQIKESERIISVAAKYTRNAVQLKACTPEGKQKHKIIITGETYDNESLIYVLPCFLKQGITHKEFWICNCLNGSYARVKFEVVGCEKLDTGGRDLEVIRTRVSSIESKAPDQYFIFANDAPHNFLKSVTGLQVIEIESLQSQER